MLPQLPLNLPYGFLGSGFHWPLLPLSVLSWLLAFFRCEAFTDLLGGGGSSLSKALLPSSSASGLGGTCPPLLLRPKSGGDPMDGSLSERRPSLSTKSSETTPPSLLVCLTLCLRCDVWGSNVGIVHNREGLSPIDLWRSIADFDMWPLYVVGRSRSWSIRELMPSPRSVWLLSLSLLPSRHTLLLHSGICKPLAFVAQYCYNSYPFQGLLHLPDQLAHYP